MIKPKKAISQIMITIVIIVVIIISMVLIVFVVSNLTNKGEEVSQATFFCNSVIQSGCATLATLIPAKYLFRKVKK